MTLCGIPQIALPKEIARSDGRQPHAFCRFPSRSGSCSKRDFKPVQAIIPFDNDADAIAIANGTAFELVESSWTENCLRQMPMAPALRARQVFANNYGAGGGVELPFGGAGLSGYEREKGLEALYRFSALKTVADLHG